MTAPGRVYLVGAGPGDPDLLTLRAGRLIAGAQALVYDRLVSPEILALAPETARRIDVGKMPKRHPVPQERINEILIELARDGLDVVRLKGGDPLVFGRGGEEVVALRAAGIAVEIVPGITSAQAAAASCAVPLTHRGLVTGIRYATGHCRAGAELELDWRGLADPDTTLVIYMGAASIGTIAGRLIENGLPAAMPVLAVASATTPRERRLVSTLAAIAKDAAVAGLTPPALFIIGRVVGLHREDAAHDSIVTEARGLLHA